MVLGHAAQRRGITSKRSESITFALVLKTVAICRLRAHNLLARTPFCVLDPRALCSGVLRNARSQGHPFQDHRPVCADQLSEFYYFSSGMAVLRLRVAVLRFLTVLAVRFRGLRDELAETMPIRSSGLYVLCSKFHHQTRGSRALADWAVAGSLRPVFNPVTKFSDRGYFMQRVGGIR